MDQKASVGIGNVPIILCGRELNLVPSPQAALTLSRTQAGIRGAIDAVVRMDMDAIVKVVGLGLGPKVVKQLPKDLMEAVWEAGLTDDTGQVVGKCIDYLHILANGGKPVNKPAEGEEEENPHEPQS